MDGASADPRGRGRGEHLGVALVHLRSFTARMAWTLRIGDNDVCAEISEERLIQRAVGAGFNRHGARVG